MAGLESRIAKLEAACEDREAVDQAALWALPFWSRLSAALAAGSYVELLQGWELARRVASVLREAERRDDPALREYAARWLMILWPDGRPENVTSVGILDDIRARLRAVLTDQTVVFPDRVDEVSA
jgi:Ser/Thr protein kinase RdoA (MazF antagonist)